MSVEIGIVSTVGIMTVGWFLGTYFVIPGYKKLMTKIRRNK